MRSMPLGSVPSFTEVAIFKIVITIEETIEESSIKGSEKTRDKIIRLLKGENELSAKDVAKAMWVSERAIEKQIAKLKEQKILKRIGPNKSGK